MLIRTLRLVPGLDPGLSIEFSSRLVDGLMFFRISCLGESYKKLDGAPPVIL